SFLNRGGCVALLDGDASDTSCGAAKYRLDACEMASCATCNSDVAASADCQTRADSWYCANAVSKRDACATRLGDDDSSPYAACGRDSEDFVTAARKVFTVFCGPAR